jgi:hypothetical protein
MLPDLTSFKRSLAERLRRDFEARVLHHAPLMAEIKTHRQREGNRYSYEAHDSGDIRRETFKTFRTPITTGIFPAPIEQEHEIAEKLDQSARDMAKQHMRLLFTTVTESSERAGTTYNAKGKPFDFDMFLGVLENLWIDFDEQGQPIYPTIVMMHPDQLKALASKFAAWEKDAALMARWRAVIDCKKDEWRARDHLRKLVG